MLYPIAKNVLGLSLFIGIFFKKPKQTIETSLMKIRDLLPTFGFTCELLTNDEIDKLIVSLHRGILNQELDDFNLKHYRKQLKSKSIIFIVNEFLNSLEFRQNHKNKLFVYPGHFYSPIVDTDEARVFLEKHSRQPLPYELPGIKIDLQEMVNLWNRILPFLTKIPFPSEKTDNFRFYFGNGNYSYGDASILHAMLLHFNPKNLIEVGSGFSSACTLDTLQIISNNNCQITFIEPYPELLNSLIGESIDNVRVLPVRIQDIPLDLFRELADGDILFIDSTHILRTGSDVCYELFQILPSLAPGVIVHFHDIFWPFEYPFEWVVNDNRSWNELYAIRAFLTENDRFKIIFFNDYFNMQKKELIDRTYPTFNLNPGGALWLQKV